MSRLTEAVEEHRDALERLAEHGQTQLAADARTLLEEADGATATGD